jgi:TolA-binding protein
MMRPIKILQALSVMRARMALVASLALMAGLPLAALALMPEQQAWVAMVKSLEKDPAGEHSLETARTFLEKFSGSPLQPAAQFALAETFFRRGQFHDALPIFESLVRTPLAALALYRASECHFNLADYPAAQEQWDRLFQLEPGTYLRPEIELDRAQLLMIHNHPEAARQAFLNIVASYPHYRENRRLAAGLAALDLAAQHPEEAFRRLEHTGSSPEILVLKGACLIDLGRYIEAARLVDEDLPGPEGTRAKAGLVVLLLEKGQYELAGYTAGRLLERPDFDASARNGLLLLAAYADVRAQKYDELDRLKINLTDFGLTGMKELVYLEGLGDFFRKRTDVAFQTWEKMFHQFANSPDLPVWLYQAAAMAFAGNDFSRAQSYCELLLSRFPEDPAAGWASLCLSQIFYKLGKDQAAMTAYRDYVHRGAQPAPENPTTSGDPAAYLRLCEPARERIQAQIREQAAVYNQAGRLSESSMVAAPWLSAIVRPPVLIIRPQKTSLHFASWNLTIAAETGKILFRESGGYPLPEKIEWDGRSLEGRMISVDEKFTYVIHLHDSAEKILLTTSKMSILNSLAYEENGVFGVHISAGLLFSKNSDHLSLLGPAVLHEACDLILQHFHGRLFLKTGSLAQAETVKFFIIQHLDLPATAIIGRAGTGEGISLECPLPDEGGGKK